MFNVGKDDIAKASATIEILGPTNEVIGRIDTADASIKSLQKGELIGTWEADTNPGMYHAVATVRYDGEVGTLEKNFYVWDL